MTGYYDSTISAEYRTDTVTFASVPTNGVVMQIFDDGGASVAMFVFTDTDPSNPPQIWVDTSSGTTDGVAAALAAAITGGVITAIATGSIVTITFTTAIYNGHPYDLIQGAPVAGSIIVNTTLNGRLPSGATQDCSDALNYWSDSDRRLRLGSAPTDLTLDVIAYDDVSTGTCSPATWIGTISRRTILGGTIMLHQSSSPRLNNITLDGGHVHVSLSGGTDGLVATNFTFTNGILDADGGDNKLNKLTLSGNSILNTDPTLVTLIQDTDGTTTWNSTITADIVATEITHGTSPTLNGTVTCDNINIPTATFGGSSVAVQSATSVTLITLVPPATVTWTGVRHPITNNVTINNTGSDIVLTWSSGATATIPGTGTDDILVGAGGNYTPPLQGTVLSVAQGGTLYGVGAATDGTLTLPGQDDTSDSVTDYGISGNSLHGNYTPFEAAFVDSTQTGGIGNSVQGGNVMPANNKVLRPADGGPTHYGPNNAQTGTLAAGTNDSVSGSYGKFYKGF